MNAKQIKAVKEYIKSAKNDLDYISKLDLETITEYDNDSHIGQMINEVSNFIGLLDDLEDLA